MVQGSEIGFYMGDNIIGIFTETSKNSHRYYFRIHGSGYMYDNSKEFRPMDEHKNNYEGFLSGCVQDVIEIPKGIKSIAKNCFYDVGLWTNRVEQIRIGEDVEYLGSEALASGNFNRGSGLKSVVLLGDNPKLREVQKGCFINQVQLTSIKFRGYVNSVWIKAFYNCMNLQEIGLADGYKYMNDEYGYYGFDGSVFFNCNKLKSISPHNTLISTIIGEQNYMYCNSLRDITILSNTDNDTEHKRMHLGVEGLYVEKFKGEQCDNDGNLITNLYTPFDEYFNDRYINWEKSANRVIVQITPSSVYVYHKGKIIKLDSFKSGIHEEAYSRTKSKTAIADKGEWKWFNTVNVGGYDHKFSPIYFNHEGNFYQFNY